MSLLKYYLIKIFYGRFSYTFQSYVINSKQGKITNKNFLQPCTKDDALNHYRSAVLNRDDTAEFFTEKKIEFQNTPFNTSFRKVVNRNKRYSCYDIYKYQDHFWKRIGVRDRIFNAGVRVIYHFIENKFFFGEIFFSDASKVNTDLIALSILRKYADQKTIPAKNFKISGKDAFIFYENTGINLSIKYIFTRNDSINQVVKALVEYSPFSKVETKSELEDLL